MFSYHCGDGSPPWDPNLQVGATSNTYSKAQRIPTGKYPSNLKDFFMSSPREVLGNKIDPPEIRSKEE